ncbi:MAG: hypothetical protein ACK4N5_11540, partial [Myxococcales bacterium]
GRAEGEAAQWLTRVLGVPADAAAQLLAPGGAPRAVPPAQPLATPVAWAPRPLPPLGGGFGGAMDLERDVDEVSSDTYQSGILPPNEYVIFHVGLVPFDVGNGGGGFVSRATPAVGFDLSFGPLEMIGPRYGLVVHDELGGRLGLGMVFGGRQEYTNGKEEGPLAFRAEARYALYAGLRFSRFGLFAGGSAGAVYARAGDLSVRGLHAEPAARLALRLFSPSQVILEASGFVAQVPNLARRDRVQLSFPLGRGGMDIKLAWERVPLGTSGLAPDGETRNDLGAKPLQVFGVQVGARL